MSYIIGDQKLQFSTDVGKVIKHLQKICKRRIYIIYAG